MTRRMNRTTAWRKVAEAFDAPRQEMTKYGLCWAISTLHGRGNGIYGRMDCLGFPWWPYHYRYAGERATFAGFMAAMTQGERDRLVPGL